MTLYFPDINSYTLGIDLAGALAVAIKVTQGTGYANPYYELELEEANRRGAYPIGFHFLNEGGGARQADWCAGHERTRPMMLDFEPMDPPQGDSHPSIGDAVDFIEQYRRDGGTVHWMYLPRWYWAREASGLGSASLQPLIDLGMQLWSSNYPDSGYTDSGDGAGWREYGGMAPLIWQYTESEQFGGMAGVDFNAFRGHYAGQQGKPEVAATLAEFIAISNTGEYPPAPPPPVRLPGALIPDVRGESAGRARARLTAAHLIPEARAGQEPQCIVTGTQPAGGKADVGAHVEIIAATAPALKQGASGPWVTLAQTDLNKSGAHLGVDGEYGPNMRKAVLAFQKDHHLRATGTIPAGTWKALGGL